MRLWLLKGCAHLITREFSAIKIYVHFSRRMKVVPLLWLDDIVLWKYCHLSTLFSMWVECPGYLWEIQEDGTFAPRDLCHGSLLCVGVGVDLWSLRELFAHLDLHLQMLSGFTKVWQQPLRSLEGWRLKRADPRVKAGPRRCVKWSPPSAHSTPSPVPAAVGPTGRRVLPDGAQEEVCGWKEAQVTLTQRQSLMCCGRSGKGKLTSVSEIFGACWQNRRSSLVPGHPLHP